MTPLPAYVNNGEAGLAHDSVLKRHDAFLSEFARPCLIGKRRTGQAGKGAVYSDMIRL